MAYTIVQGTKGNSFQDMLWEMLGVSTWAHMFISCNYCDQSIGIKFDNPEEMATMTNEQFINIVREQGAGLFRRWGATPEKRATS